MTIHRAVVTSKGQLTLPVELRRSWGLDQGDEVEFVTLGDGRTLVRPRNLSATAIFGILSHLKADPAYASDDDAIAAQVMAEDDATKISPSGGGSA